MSGYANINAYSDPNVLLSTLSGKQTADVTATQAANQQNQLLYPLQVQAAQQKIGGDEMEMMGRAAAGLLSLPDEASRAAAYPGAVSRLQANGFAKNAPAQYPGEATLRTFAGNALPVEKQYELGILTPPGLAAALGGTRPAPGPGGAPAAGGPAPNPGGSTIGQRQNNPGNLTFAGQPGASPGQGNRFASFPDMPTGVAANADQLALYATQHGINTVRGAVTRWVGDPKADLGSYIGDISKALGVGPDDKIDLTDPAVQAKFIQAQFPHESAGGGFVLSPTDVAKGVQISAANRGRPVQAPGTTVVATGPGGGVAARTGGTDVAGPGAGPSATPTAPAATPPAGGWTSGTLTLPDGTSQPLRLPPGATPPDGFKADAAPATTPPAQPPVATPQAPPPVAQNTLAPPAPPAQPPAAQPPAQPPAGTAAAARANLPHYTDVPSGPNSQARQQFQAIQDQINQLIPYASLPAAKAKIAQLQSQQQVLMSTDSVVQTQEGPFHPLTGVLDKPVEPLANYVFSPDAGGPGVPGFIDTTQTHEPKISPARRLVQRPDGTVIDDTGRIVSPADLPGAAAAAAAKTSGEAIGTATGKLTGQLADQGRTATQAITNIDYGLSQIAKAKEGGIPTGYFAPWLGTVAAIGKSLGVDTSGLGVDPTAVGNIQTAGKTLAVVSGAILQQVLGPDSQITDAKIQHFIHAQPGIETDPEALNRVLNWARAQFVYEREMSAQGMKDASATGVLPTNWQAKYYADHGFAPIYNPQTGEVQQPDGSAPPRSPPATVATAPINPSARTAGTTYNTPKGPMKWTGTGWLPPGQ